MKQIRMYSTTTALLFYSQLNSKVGNILIKDTALRNKNAGGRDHNHVQQLASWSATVFLFQAIIKRFSLSPNSTCEVDSVN